MISGVQASSPQSNLFEQDFHKTFVGFATAVKCDELIQRTDFEKRILQELDAHRTSDRKNMKSVSFEEFGILREKFGLPFASKELGYWVKDGLKSASIEKACGRTARSSDFSDFGEVRFQTYFDQLCKETKSDASLGISEAALKTYYNARKSKGITGPEKWQGFGSFTWSNEYDVGFKAPIPLCDPHYGRARVRNSLRASQNSLNAGNAARP